MTEQRNINSIRALCGFFGPNSPAKDYDVPILEAAIGFRGEVTGEDISFAQPFDPCHCAFANSIWRGMNLGADNLRPVVTDNWAYIPRKIVKGPKAGTWAIFKHQVPSGERAKLLGFDRAGSFQPGTYKFTPVPHQLLKKSKAAAKARYRARVASGEVIPKPYEAMGSRPGAQRRLDARKAIFSVDKLASAD